MDDIKICRAFDSTVTTISNEFIDCYMPQANGEFVKIYLYFLRYSLCPAPGVSLATAADTFSMTETDILRALKYWQQQGILKLDIRQNRLCELTLLPIGKSHNMNINMPQPHEMHTADAAVQTYNGVPAYTMEDIANFRRHNDGDQLFFIIEQYLGKPLGPTDINTIVYFSEHLGFSADLIEYLFEYCVSNNHYSIHYIEKIALAWAKEGIDTVSKARSRSTYYNKTSFDILKAFGISGRNPAPNEVEYIQRWTRRYGFPMPLILEACRRTMETTHSPSFAYTESILKKWYDSGVGSMDDVKKLDEAHEKQRTEQADRQAARAKSAAAGNAERKPAHGNKFHNFEQRNYDYGQLEQKFLGKLNPQTNPGTPGGN